MSQQYVLEELETFFKYSLEINLFPDKNLSDGMRKPLLTQAVMQLAAITCAIGVLRVCSTRPPETHEKQSFQNDVQKTS